MGVRSHFFGLVTRIQHLDQLGGKFFIANAISQGGNGRNTPALRSLANAPVCCAKKATLKRRSPWKRSATTSPRLMTWKSCAVIHYPRHTRTTARSRASALGIPPCTGHEIFPAYRGQNALSAAKRPGSQNHKSATADRRFGRSFCNESIKGIAEGCSKSAIGGC